MKSHLKFKNTEFDFNFSFYLLVTFSVLEIEAQKIVTCKFASDFCLLENGKLFLNEIVEIDGTREQKVSVTRLWIQNYHLENLAGKFSEDFPNLKEVKITKSILKLHENSLEILKEIRTLKVFNNRILVIDEGTFKNLSNLEILELYLNYLEKIPGTLFSGNLKLRKLNLNYNVLRNLDRDLLTELVELDEFSISWNQLLSVPGRLFRNTKKIIKISLNRNKIPEIPENLLEGLELLESLNLSGNRLQILPTELFRDTRNLKDLQLYRNRIKILSPSIFENLVNLKILNLENNNCVNKKIEQFQELTLDLRKCHENCKLDTNCNEELMKKQIAELEAKIRAMNPQ